MKGEKITDGGKHMGRRKRMDVLKHIGGLKHIELIPASGWKHAYRKITGIVLVSVLMLALFAGCGQQSASSSLMDRASKNVDMQFGSAVKASTDGARSGAQTAEVGANGAASTAEAGEAPAAADSIAGGGDLTQEVNNAILAERKIIRSANITVEVGNFDEAYGKISNFILGIGFIQETNINTDRVYVDDKQKLVKRGTITIRVDKQKFDSVLNSLKGLGDVMNWTINGQDVTDKYIDIESRLRLLNLEESQLEEYLKKLTDLDQIFKIESRLTDIRQEIESLTGNLKKMSDLVDLSTITINMNEKYPGAVIPQKAPSYWQRLLSNLLDSSKGVINFCGELIIIVVAALPVLILLGLIVLAAILIYRKLNKNRKGTSSISTTVGNNPGVQETNRSGGDKSEEDGSGAEGQPK